VLCLHGKGWIRPEEEHLNYWHCFPFCAESYSSFVFCKGVTGECTAQTSTASRTTRTCTSMNLQKTVCKRLCFSSHKGYFLLKLLYSSKPSPCLLKINHTPNIIINQINFAVRFKQRRCSFCCLWEEFPCFIYFFEQGDGRTTRDIFFPSWYLLKKIHS